MSVEILNTRRLRRGVAVRVRQEALVSEVSIGGDGAGPEHGGGLKGFGTKGARAIRDTAETYLAAFMKLDPEKRCKLLLDEAEAYRTYRVGLLEDTVLKTAQEIHDHDAEGGSRTERPDTADVYFAEKARTEADDEWSAVLASIHLIFGDNIVYRWEWDDKRVAAKAEEATS